MIIKLDNISKLKQFVDDCSKIDAEIEVEEVGSNHFTANAKSFLGMTTLNLSGPLQLRVLAQSDHETNIYDAFRDYRWIISDS